MFESHSSTSVQIDFINSRNSRSNQLRDPILEVDTLASKPHFVDKILSKIEVVTIAAKFQVLS